MRPPRSASAAPCGHRSLRNVFVLAALTGPLAAAAPAGDPVAAAVGPGDRLAHLTSDDPFWPGLRAARLVTPQWVGEDDVDAVVVLAIDDLRDTARYEEYLRPILERLKEIDGRAPVSVMANRIDPEDPRFGQWLEEGLTVECHTLDHPCPILAGGDIEAARATYEGSIDLVGSIPGNEPVAFRVPCMDSINSPSPRFYGEVFPRVTGTGRFLRIDSSIPNITTPADPGLPRRLVLEADGRERFRKYLPFPSFVATVEDYPYPWVIGRRIWELPCVVPSDWEGQNLRGPNDPGTLRDLLAQLEVCVRKRGTYTLVFHPHGWIRSEQMVELVDRAATRWGRRVLFLNFREVHDRLVENLLGGEPLRAADGGDNGVRVLDVDHDGYVDVVTGNERLQQTRVWSPEDEAWRETGFPVPLVARGPDGGRRRTGVRFGVVDPDGRAACLVRSEDAEGAWTFADGAWRAAPELLAGLEVDGRPVRTAADGHDLGVRLRDLDGDGRCELIRGGPGAGEVFAREPDGAAWKRLPFDLPEEVSLVDAEGRDAGVRLADIDGDLREDVLLSGGDRQGLWLFASMHEGWARQVLPREGGAPPPDIPPLTLDGVSSGAWFRDGALWVQNEHTAELPDLVDRVSFHDLLEGVPPRPLDPRAARASFRTAPGFRVELVASEPLVADPVAFDWDTEGRLWVVEMRDYPSGRPEGEPGGGRVVVLEDRDGNGRYDLSRPFLEGIDYPTTVKPWRDGALVLTVPDLLYAKDADGDGRADERRVLYTGFRPGNPQHLANGLAWGLDGWLHGANGDSGGRVRSLVADGEREVEMGGRDFRLRPATGAIEATTGRTQFGRARDAEGNWFGCSNPRPMFQLVLEERYLRRNPHAAPATPRIDVVPATGPVHPASRPLPRFNDLHMAGRFTSCCGLEVYRDEVLGPQASRWAFVSEPAHNLVHRIVLEDDGLTFSGERAAGEETSEFLASRDNWFRPATLRAGPDGALYVADMYRRVIEHPQYFFTGDVGDLDVRAGDDRGRIWRVVPVGRPLRTPPRLAGLEGLDLAGAMDTASGTVRDRVQERILARGDEGAVPALRELARHAERSAVRLQALATLAGLAERGLDALDTDLMARTLADPSPGVRRRAVVVAERFFAGREAIEAPFLARAADPAPRVRLQAAGALGEWPGEAAGRALAQLALRDAGNRWILAHAGSSALPHLPVLIETTLAALHDAESAEAPAGDAAGTERAAERRAARGTLLGRWLRLAFRAGPEARATALEAARDLAHVASDTAERPEAWRLRAAAELLRAAAEAGGDPEAAGVLRSLRAPARALASARDAPAAERAVAVRFLGAAASALAPEDADARRSCTAELAGLLAPGEPPALRRAALEAVRDLGGPEAPEALLAGWPSHTPATRRRVLDALLDRPAWHEELLDAIASGRVDAAELDATRRRRLLAARNEAVAGRAAELLERERGSRADVVERFSAAAELEGVPDRGAVIFEETCATCHSLAGRGEDVGPDLRTAADQSFEGLLTAVLDPNRAVEDRWIQYAVTLRDGRVISGIVEEETATGITLRSAEGRRTTALRRNVTSLESSGVSLMPEGLEAEWSLQDLADLIAWIRSRETPPKEFPGNRPAVVHRGPDGRLRLLAKHAEVRGPSLVFEPHYANLGYWGHREDRATWTVEVPGTAQGLGGPGTSGGDASTPPRDDPPESVSRGGGNGSAADDGSSATGAPAEAREGPAGDGERDADEAGAAAGARDPASAATAYEVRFRIACPNSEAGGTFRLETRGGALRGEVPPTGSWDRYETIDVGRVELPPGRQRITLRSDGPVDGVLVDLQEITLVPTE